MNIQPISPNYNQPKSNVGFKAVYPVVHWVAEKQGSYSLVSSFELSKQLQTALVRLLNSKGAKNLQKALQIINLQKYVSGCDWGYRNLPKTCSYNNKKGGWENFRYTPISYLLTGRDVAIFQDAYGKPLGKAKHDALVGLGYGTTPELNNARRDYVIEGLKYVNKRASEFKNKDNIPMELHTKFEVVRDKAGEIKGYELLGIKFIPSNAPENPLIAHGYVK